MSKRLYPSIILTLLALYNFTVHAQALNVTTEVDQKDVFKKAYSALEQKKYLQAIKWLEIIANQGDSYAQFNLGVIYSNQNFGFTDFGLAAKWYEKAAIQGDVNAQNNLGKIHEFRTKNNDLAIEWYEKAAKQGYAPAQNNLGRMQEHVMKDYKLAIKWYEKAAEQGLPDAQNNLGALYQRVYKDHATAAMWYQKAAAQNYAFAQTNLGEIYEDGNLGEVNYELASKWYEKSASQGEYNAQLFLGGLYYDGYLGEKNITLASKWLVNAANNEDGKAAKLVIQKIESKDSVSHNIAGSKAQLTGVFEVVTDVQVSRLQVRLIREYFTLDCQQGFREHIEINGEINNDSSFVVEQFLDKINPCVGFDGSEYVTAVYLNSGGGLLNDGYKLGSIFKSYGVSANVTYGQVCASSCAISFLGAKFRYVNGDGILLFHAPYVVAGYGNIYCSSDETEYKLKAYYSEMLGSKKGATLFNRTMDYCSSSDGWTINSDAADIYGLTTS